MRSWQPEPPSRFLDKMQSPRAPGRCNNARAEEHQRHQLIEEASFCGIFLFLRGFETLLEGEASRGDRREMDTACLVQNTAEAPLAEDRDQIEHADIFACCGQCS